MELFLKNLKMSMTPSFFYSYYKRGICVEFVDDVLHPF